MVWLVSLLVVYYFIGKLMPTFSNIVLV